MNNPDITCIHRTHMCECKCSLVKGLQATVTHSCVLAQGRSVKARFTHRGQHITRTSWLIYYPYIVVNILSDIVVNILSVHRG